MTGVEDELTFMKEVVMRTNDQWRHNRRLVNDAMSPRFLSNTAGQQVYNQALNLVELWRQKIRLSKGHAFNLRADLQLFTAVLSGPPRLETISLHAKCKATT